MPCSISNPLLTPISTRSGQALYAGLETTHFKFFKVTSTHRHTDILYMYTSAWQPRMKLTPPSLPCRKVKFENLHPHNFSRDFPFSKVLQYISIWLLADHSINTENLYLTIWMSRKLHLIEQFCKNAASRVYRFLYLKKSSSQAPSTSFACHSWRLVYQQ